MDSFFRLSLGEEGKNTQQEIIKTNPSQKHEHDNYNFAAYAKVEGNAHRQPHSSVCRETLKSDFEDIQFRLECSNKASTRTNSDQ